MRLQLLVAGVGRPALGDLPLEGRIAPKREVGDADPVRRLGRQRRPVQEDIVVALPDLDASQGPMADLGGQRQAERADRPVLAVDHHARSLFAIPPGERRMVPAPDLERRAAGRGLGQHLLQGRAGRRPELVVVIVDHPIGRVLRGRQPGHPGHPFGLAEFVLGLVDKLRAARADVFAHDCRRLISRPVVGDDEEIDALLQMELDVLAQQLAGIPDQQGHQQLHG